MRRINVLTILLLDNVSTVNISSHLDLRRLGICLAQRAGRQPKPLSAATRAGSKRLHKEIPRIRRFGARFWGPICTFYGAAHAAMQGRRRKTLPVYPCLRCCSLKQLLGYRGNICNFFFSNQGISQRVEGSQLCAQAESRLFLHKATCVNKKKKKANNQCNALKAHIFRANLLALGAPASSRCPGSRVGSSRSMGSRSQPSPSCVPQARINIGLKPTSARYDSRSEPRGSLLPPFSRCSFARRSGDLGVSIAKNWCGAEPCAESPQILAGSRQQGAWQCLQATSSPPCYRHRLTARPFNYFNSCHIYLCGFPATAGAASL
ncbi:uncharacterized protein LOC121065408 [Cygnus olor]|uniref:uncharacterized protein LOC121065408 n=1 Tax=Cygnus olor TaxID=8869 RepID=UPI001ADE7222|nr:uncharacterized protein LOC121065408 [Cygnus olor]